MKIHIDSSEAYRSIAHSALDRLWQQGYMSRKMAYVWLTTELKGCRLRKGQPTVHIKDLPEEICLMIPVLVSELITLLDEAEVPPSEEAITKAFDQARTDSLTKLRRDEPNSLDP